MTWKKLRPEFVILHQTIALGEYARCLLEITEEMVKEAVASNGMPDEIVREKFKRDMPMYVESLRECADALELTSFGMGVYHSDVEGIYQNGESKFNDDGDREVV